MEAWLPTLLLLRDYEIPTLITVYRCLPISVCGPFQTHFPLNTDKLILIPLACLSWEDVLPSCMWLLKKKKILGTVLC